MKIKMTKQRDVRISSGQSISYLMGREYNVPKDTADLLIGEKSAVAVTEPKSTEKKD